MQHAVIFQMITHLPWVFILVAKDVKNECNFTLSQSALEHDTIDKYNIITIHKSLLLIHNLQHLDK